MVNLKKQSLIAFSQVFNLFWRPHIKSARHSAILYVLIAFYETLVFDLETFISLRLLFLYFLVETEAFLLKR